MHHNYLEKKLDKNAHYFAYFYLFLLLLLIFINIVIDLEVKRTEFLVFALLPVVLYLIFALLIGLLLVFLKMETFLKPFNKSK